MQCELIHYTMMKTICFTALLVANLLLLAHASIPHHHHENGEICFLSYFEKCEKNVHHTERTDRCSHKHENEGNTSSEKCCSIDNIYTPSNNNIKFVCPFHVKYDCKHTLYALISSTLNINDFVDDKIIHFRQNPLLLFYSQIISGSIGLRAPPVLNN